MLRESILKDILYKESMALSGIKENRRENRGREIPSEANSILSKFPPLTVTMTTPLSFLFCFWCAYVNFGLTALCFFLHPSPQGVVPVRHQLPSCETQQPRRVGDQTGNGTGKQFLGSDVPEKGLLHSRRVGLNLTYLPMFFMPAAGIPSFIPFVQNISGCIKCLKGSVIFLLQGHKTLH